VSRYSNHHQFCAAAGAVLDAAEAWLWSEPDTLDVTRLPLAGSAAHLEQLDTLPEDQLWRGWVVAAEPDGWTVLWGTWGGDDEALVLDIARDLGCDALYGHHNDQVDNWRWIRIFAGRPRDQYWYTGQAWYRWSDLPAEAMTPWQACASMGRSYAHESFVSAHARLVHEGRAGDAHVLTHVFSARR
jgi:hypothetical protein